MENTSFWVNKLFFPSDSTKTHPADLIIISIIFKKLINELINFLASPWWAQEAVYQIQL